MKMFFQLHFKILGLILCRALQKNSIIEYYRKKNHVKYFINEVKMLVDFKIWPKIFEIIDGKLFQLIYEENTIFSLNLKPV